MTFLEKALSSMTDASHSAPESSPNWQVYVYFKVPSENKSTVIEQCLQLANNLKELGVSQSLMERADVASHSEEAIPITLMEVYTPTHCNNSISVNAFIKQLQHATLNWCANTSGVPARITEVFINAKVT